MTTGGASAHRHMLARGLATLAQPWLALAARPPFDADPFSGSGARKDAEVSPSAGDRFGPADRRPPNPDPDPEVHELSQRHTDTQHRP